MIEKVVKRIHTYSFGSWNYVGYYLRRWLTLKFCYYTRFTVSLRTIWLSKSQASERVVLFVYPLAILRYNQIVC